MPEKRRGRKSGEKRGEGAVQLFIRRRGGRRFICSLYRDFRSANAVAGYIQKRYNFFCCGNTIRNILREYHVPLNPAGGDRRSKRHRRFMTAREENCVERRDE